eukprot:487734-Alexandrium_andersonii.AAC.1
MEVVADHQQSYLNSGRGGSSSPAQEVPQLGQARLRWRGRPLHPAGHGAGAASRAAARGRRCVRRGRQGQP